MKAFLLSSSPRRDGNSAQLLAAVARGLKEAGHEATLIYVGDILTAFLQDCRRCRKADGECSITDGFRETFFDEFLPAQGFIAATPIYWYGMSAQLKTFFDRMFCYTAASSPRSGEAVQAMLNKRFGLVMSSEENFPTVSSGIVHQMQECARYMHSTFVGVVHGIANARSDIALDPQDSLGRAQAFGATFFDAYATDYKIDTPRSPKIWS